MTEPEYHGTLESALGDFIRVCGMLSGTVGGAAGRAEKQIAHSTTSEGSPTTTALPETAPARAVLKALIECVLPVAHPEFPLSSQVVAARCGLFFREERRAEDLRRSLLLFEDAGSFARIVTPALAEERRMLEAYPSNTPALVRKHLDQKRAQDEKLLGFFFKKRGAETRSFAAMDAAVRREYFWLWSQSGFALKRRFYKTARAAIAALACAAPEADNR